MTTRVPPIKCQGIKTKLLPHIFDIIKNIDLKQRRWIEPFGGSCVVPLNIQPYSAIISDINIHIIRFYKSIQENIINPAIIRDYLEDADQKLRLLGQDYYYEVRTRFNKNSSSLDFLFLNRACFNGMMRFNRKGEFNVPFCRKPDRFRQAYITKIVNQVKAFQKIVQHRDWDFQVADFRQVLAQVTEKDIVYLDPPYQGRHVDYYSSWDDEQQKALIEIVQTLPCPFIFSTWHSNKYRRNIDIDTVWNNERFTITTINHFYHVGATESLRNPMLEALITNFSIENTTPLDLHSQQLRMEIS